MVNTAISKGRAAKSKKATVAPAERRRAAAAPGPERRRATPAELLAKV